MFDTNTTDQDRRGGHQPQRAPRLTPSRTLSIRGIHLVAGIASTAFTHASARPGSRRIAVMSAAGERRHADLTALGLRCAKAFDAVVVYEDAGDQQSLGRAARVILEGARQAEAPHHQRHCKLDIVNALRFALDLCHAGDTLVFGCASFDQLASTLAACEPEAARALA